MRPMIDVNTIPKDKPSQNEIKYNMWRYKNLLEIGVLFNPDSNNNTNKTMLKYFKTSSDYTKAQIDAIAYIDKRQEIPKELKERLVKEKENLESQGAL